MNWFNTTKYGYRYDRRLAFLCMVFIVALAGYVMYVNNFNFGTMAYVECRQGPCKNPILNYEKCQQQLNVLWVIPIYKSTDCRETCQELWCDQEYLPAGTYGEKPKANKIYDNFLAITLTSFIILLIMNHLLHNRGEKFDLEIPFTKKHKFNFTDYVRKMNKNENNKDNF